MKVLDFKPNTHRILSGRGGSSIPAYPLISPPFGEEPGEEQAQGVAERIHSYCAIHSMPVIESRFQRWPVIRLFSWGDAPGWYEIAPLALKEMTRGMYADVAKWSSHPS
jgi:hypothetical protein